MLGITGTHRSEYLGWLTVSILDKPTGATSLIGKNLKGWVRPLQFVMVTDDHQFTQPVTDSGLAEENITAHNNGLGEVTIWLEAISLRHLTNKNHT